MKKILLAVGLSSVLFVGGGQKKEEPKSSTAPTSSTISEQSASSTLESTTMASRKTESTKTVSEVDLDTEAILNGDFTTLAGTWKNGRGQVLVIKADGSLNDNGRLLIEEATKSEANIAKIPAQPGSTPAGGFLLLLYKIGQTNPVGDNSDQSKARLIAAQSSATPSAEDYYYRAEDTEESPVTIEEANVITTQEQAKQQIFNTLGYDDDMALVFMKMIDNDYLFKLVSKTMVANGGSGSAGFYRVTPQGEVNLVDGEGN